MNDNDIPASKGGPNRPLQPRAWPRHAVAAIVALAMNAGLLAFLTTSRDTSPRTIASPLLVVPLQVVEDEPAKAKLAPADAVDVTTPPQPNVVHLPVPTLPQARPADVRLDTPRLPALPMAHCNATDVPTFIAHLPPDSGVPNNNSIPAVSRAGEGDTTDTLVSPDCGPVMLKPPDLSEYYPRRAKLRGVSGITTVRLTVDSRGVVTGVEVIRSMPAGVFDLAARRLARSLAFLPARRGGRAVSTTAKMNFVWKLD